MLINGKTDSRLSVMDRGVQYGDGVFETIAVTGGLPCLWDRHIERLLEGCRRLGFPAPDLNVLFDEAERVIASADSGVLKIIISRGIGGRGYRPPDEVNPNRILTCSPVPEFQEDASQRGVAIRTCSNRLGRNASLAGIKHLNRLEQVLASMEWSDPLISEGLMLDVNDRVIEGIKSNLFVVKEGVLRTPDLTQCGVSGVMRALVIDIAKSMDISVVVSDITMHDLRMADGLFLTNSLIGIWPVRELDGQRVNSQAVDQQLIERVMEQGFQHG